MSKIRIGNQAISTKEKESYIFHVRPRRGTNNSKLKYKLVEDKIKEISRDVAENQLDRFLETLHILTSCLFVQ